MLSYSCFYTLLYPEPQVKLALLSKNPTKAAEMEVNKLEVLLAQVLIGIVIVDEINVNGTVIVYDIVAIIKRW